MAIRRDSAAFRSRRLHAGGASAAEQSLFATARTAAEGVGDPTTRDPAPRAPVGKGFDPERPPMPAAFARAGVGGQRVSPDPGVLDRACTRHYRAAVEPRGEVAAAPRVGVVVLDWNGGLDTLAAVDSVFSDTAGLDVDAIVVDNASREPVLDEVRRRHGSVRTVASPRNEGYAGGNNLGIRLALDAGAEYVLVLNNDALLRPGALRALVDTARADPAVGAVGAKILRTEDPSRLWLAWGEINWRQSLVRLVGAGRLDGPRWSVARDVPWVSGCAILLSRRALERIGAFDEEYFAYHEEVDWCARAREAGLRVVWQPAAVVLHRGQASSGGATYVSRKQYLAARNAVRFVRSHGTAMERARFWAFLGATLPFQWLRRAWTGEQEGVRLKVAGVRDALLDHPIPRRELGLDG